MPVSEDQLSDVQPELVARKSGGGLRIRHQHPQRHVGRRAARRGALRARPERHRQVDAPEGAVRLPLAGLGRDLSRQHDADRRAVASDGPLRHHLSAAAAEHLPVPVGRGESSARHLAVSRQPQPRRRAYRRRLRPLPDPEGTPPAGRRHDVGRPAAPAGNRPRAADRPGGDADRRAHRQHRAARRRADLRADRRPRARRQGDPAR